MCRIVVVNSVTLDGVTQAPGHPDEDRRDGFAHGGWAAPYGDSVFAEAMAKSMSTTGALLFGRRTYEHFHAVWPNQPEPNPFTDVLNRTRKYVASRTLTEPLPWQNSTLLAGEAADAVRALKQQPGKDVVILGSGALVRSLMAHGLIDEFLLAIHPVVLGSGQRLFDGSMASLRLTESVTTTTGVVVATYRSEEGTR
ncbi:Dihydrofolate reductase [Actinokineospora alba]|uniref:Dihydrofolate reductase n=1 Tax=Actinokineospora alba TaxID=504798 RepID=A0A1H0UTW1_9PSEU|nr:dihydrofolate reductase family protein [Actinokineospora alba]TDP69059.1 dihydrofolate reductase [Actinokineospora alba]SDI78590.1 Dihydrofolate reductase [Actinokineospora alba]SDP69719.1 Dihydrofolate reductase [Actinokineospora alba]